MNAVAHAEPTTTNESALLQAVCYRCRYVGLAAGTSKCPLCTFPLILEAVEVDDTPDVEQIFERQAVNVGAPPLPGVDGTPREAQLRAEARRKRISESRPAITLPPPRKIERCGTGTAVPPPRFLRARVAMALAGAVVAGLVAAVAIH